MQKAFLETCSGKDITQAGDHVEDAFDATHARGKRAVNYRFHREMLNNIRFILTIDGDEFQ